MKTGPRLSESNQGLETEHRNRLDNQTMTKLRDSTTKATTRPSTREYRQTQQEHSYSASIKHTKQRPHRLSTRTNQKQPT